MEASPALGNHENFFCVQRTFEGYYCISLIHLRKHLCEWYIQGCLHMCVCLLIVCFLVCMSVCLSVYLCLFSPVHLCVCETATDKSMENRCSIYLQHARHPCIYISSWNSLDNMHVVNPVRSHCRDLYIAPNQITGVYIQFIQWITIHRETVLGMRNRVKSFDPTLFKNYDFNPYRDSQPLVIIDSYWHRPAFNPGPLVVTIGATSLATVRVWLRLIYDTSKRNIYSALFHVHTNYHMKHH